MVTHKITDDKGFTSPKGLNSKSGNSGRQERKARSGALDSADLSQTENPDIISQSQPSMVDGEGQHKPKRNSDVVSNTIGVKSPDFTMKAVHEEFKNKIRKKTAEEIFNELESDDVITLPQFCSKYLELKKKYLGSLK